MTAIPQYTHRVARLIQTGDSVLSVGDLVNALTWNNIHHLVQGEWIIPLGDDELAEVNGWDLNAPETSDDNTPIDVVEIPSAEEVKETPAKKATPATKKAPAKKAPAKKATTTAKKTATKKS